MKIDKRLIKRIKNIIMEMDLQPYRKSELFVSVYNVFYKTKYKHYYELPKIIMFVVEIFTYGNNDVCKKDMLFREKYLFYGGYL